MSVLGRRLAATEGAYFLQESKTAAGRRAAQIKKSTPESNPPATSAAENNLADVLPEVLRHSIPLRADQTVISSSLAGESKWNLGNAMHTPFRRPIGSPNPLKEFLSLPQVTFGPKRWQLPQEGSSTMASTANEMRRERYEAPVDPEKMKAAADGISRIGAAFAIATALVFGGAASVLTLTASKLHVQNTDDLRARGRELMKPTAEIFHASMTPFRTWVENNTTKWKSTEKVITEESQKQFSEMLGRRDH